MVFSGIVAYIDYFLPPEVPVDALYAIPIWLALANFGYWWGFATATGSVMLFYFSNFLPLQAKDPGHFWLSLLLTYLLFLAFNYGGEKYLKNRRRLNETRETLQKRLLELDNLNRQAEQWHAENLKIAVVEERNRIAREIHDVLAQGFTAIILQVEAAQVLKDSSPETQERLAQIDRLARYNLQEARRSVSNLRPQLLENATLAQALETKLKSFGAETGIAVAYSSSGTSLKLPQEVDTALLRITQEALSNIRKHACATLVQLALDYDEEEICLTVQDNGNGFEVYRDNSPGDGRYGLSSMGERARMVGGMFNLQSRPGQGCRVRIIIPYK
jgi:signal transduction histidine kinase